ncbi:hypothetical protein [Microbacterium sp. P04]
MARPEFDGSAPDTGTDTATPDTNVGVHHNDLPPGSIQYRGDR